VDGATPPTAGDGIRCRWRVEQYHRRRGNIYTCYIREY